MNNSVVKLYDSTLRDGAQSKGVNFSLNDKLKILEILNDMGLDYIEGGCIWYDAKTWKECCK